MALHGGLLRLCIVLFLASIGAGLISAPQTAEASHFGNLTINGRVTFAHNGAAAGYARVTLYNVNYQAVRTVYANANGYYSITASKNHKYYLEAGTKIGSWCPGIQTYAGYSNWFTPQTTWSNPTSPSLARLAVYFQGYAC